MDEADFAVKRPDLLKELASYTWASRTTDLTKQAVAATGDRGKVIASQVRRQFFSPVMAEVLEAKLKAAEAKAGKVPGPGKTEGAAVGK
jgi:hypothetical protein